MQIITERNKPKLLVVSPTPPPYSGPEVMTANLLQSPLKDSYELIHFNISKNREVSTKARFDRVNIIYGLLQPIKLFWLMAKHKPDVVYTNWAQNLGGFLRYASFILTIALFRKPVIVRVMGDGFDHFYASANPILQKIIALTLRKITRFIVRADVLKKQFTGIVPAAKLCVVYSGIDTNAFNQPRSELPNDQIRVLFVGYLTKAKGAFDLVRTVPEVVAKQPNVIFQMMGDNIDVERNITYVNSPNSNKATLQQLLSHEETSHYVELLGVRAGEKKISTFVNADIFVLPSYSEAFPTVVLEAMAAKLPVVATPVGVLPEIFDEQHIIFVEPGNINQLSTAILKLAQNPELRQTMGMSNQQIVQRHFNLQAYAKRVSTIIETVLHEDE